MKSLLQGFNSSFEQQKKDAVNLYIGWQSTPVFLPGESHGQRNLAGYSPWGRSRTSLSDETKPPNQNHPMLYELRKEEEKQTEPLR